MPRTPAKKSSLARRLADVRLLILDVDGTLTDGSLYLGKTEELKAFHIADGLGIKLLMKAGVEVAIVTGRRSHAVTRRARELGIRRVYQQQKDKAACVERLIRRLGLEPRHVAALGDDLPDLPVFSRCGVRLAVADAAPELRAAADWIAPRPGGRGAARDAAELILKAQRRWNALLAEFLEA
jgi:3-deoxy-D-manno-octulosonate 8-phosphate phosphatase (KDO 8-P phosphatase)